MTVHLVTISGAVEPDALWRALEIDDPTECSNRLFWLLDLRGAKLELPNDGIHALTSRIDGYRQLTTCRTEKCYAALLVSDPVSYGISRIVAAYLEPKNVIVRVSYDESEASEWLTEQAA